MKQIILLTLLVSSCIAMAQTPKRDLAKSEASRFQLVVPKALWERIFFPSINERAKIAKLPTLRSALPKDDLELRIWHGFGLTALEGFVLRRLSGKWTAIHLDSVHPEFSRRNNQKVLSVPKSGWDECWRKLVEMEILTLPDAHEVSMLDIYQ